MLEKVPSLDLDVAPNSSKYVGVFLGKAALAGTKAQAFFLALLFNFRISCRCYPSPVFESGSGTFGTFRKGVSDCNRSLGHHRPKHGALPSPPATPPPQQEIHWLPYLLLFFYLQAPEEFQKLYQEAKIDLLQFVKEENRNAEFLNSIMEGVSGHIAQIRNPPPLSLTQDSHSLLPQQIKVRGSGLSTLLVSWQGQSERQDSSAVVVIIPPLCADEGPSSCCKK